MQARLQMLVWYVTSQPLTNTKLTQPRWDATLALTSRQGCVLSESIIISLLNRKGPDNSTFWNVAGCPEALFRHMVRLGTYAREFEVTANMTCVRFEMDPVLEVEGQIKEWTDPGYEGFNSTSSLESTGSDLDYGDQANYKEDLHHCAEAWRYGLLIYINRIFKWKRDQPAPSNLGFLARKTLNHVTSCRRSTIHQKHLLLPVFLAGCETKDEHLRKEARMYCNWWNEQTRYDMFLTVGMLLEEVWSSDGVNSWWGSVIDQKSRTSACSIDSRHYLLG